MIKNKTVQCAALALFLSITQTLWAGEQAEQSSQAQMQQFSQQMAVDLQLTPEQQAEVQVINERFAKELQKNQDEDLSRIEKFRSLRETSESRDHAMKEVLTKDQMEKFNELKAERRAEMKARRNASS